MRKRQKIQVEYTTPEFTAGPVERPGFAGTHVDAGPPPPKLTYLVGGTEPVQQVHGLMPLSLAKKLRVSIQHINTLINGKRAMTAQTALLLSRELKTSPELWMSLQNAVDLYHAKRNLQPTRN